MRAIHIVVLLAFGLGACAADELTEHATVPAFPETRDKAGVAYFFVEHNHSRRRFLTQAYDVNGNLFGELRVELTTARWPGQYNGYERPTRLRISMGSDTLELAYGTEDDADGFTMTSGGTVWQSGLSRSLHARRGNHSVRRGALDSGRLAPTPGGSLAARRHGLRPVDRYDAHAQPQRQSYCCALLPGRRHHPVPSRPLQR